MFSDRASSGESRATSGAAADTAAHGGGSMPEVSHLGWGRWYTLRELEDATNCLSDENVIGEGGYGIVYSGVLTDNTRVAVKNLLNNRYIDLFTSINSFYYYYSYFSKLTVNLDFH